MLEQLLAVFDFIFAPFLVFNPVISLVFVATALTAIVLVINRFSINRKAVREIKDRMEQIRENLTRAQKEGNKEETNKFLSEMMKTNNDYMKQTFRALVISIIVLALFLPWLKYRYEGKAVASLPFSLPFVGDSLGWVFWYVLVSFTVGWVIKKLLGIDYA
jgi:uncharacterized membrane protein (DUF106 family)